MKYQMKGAFRVLSVLVLCGLVFMTGCQRKEQGAAASGDELFPGKIAVITNTVSQNEEEYRSAEQLVRKYGADKIVHVTWPDNFMAEQEQMISIVTRLAHDRDIRAMVINQAVPGTNPAVDRLREIRGDEVFVVYANPGENPPDASSRADLILNTDDIARGPAIALQAQSQGAKVLVHYSFPRHMSNVLLSGRRDGMRQMAAELGMQFVDATAPDPTGDAGITGAQQFIFEDVPRMIERYGQDTAFFATNCAMMVPLQVGVLEGGAIFPEPCCPSPTHGFPSAFGIETGAGQETDIPFIISQITNYVAERDMQGRFSTWAAPAAMTWTNAGAEYAIKWIRGEVPADTIDEAVLGQLISEYIFDFTSTVVNASISSFVDESTGQSYPNYKLVIMDSLVF